MSGIDQGHGIRFLPRILINLSATYVTIRPVFYPAPSSRKFPSFKYFTCSYDMYIIFNNTEVVLPLLSFFFSFFSLFFVNATQNGNEWPHRVELVPDGANATVSVLDAHNGPCVIMRSDVAASDAVKCWGPNGYGSLGVVRHRLVYVCRFGVVVCFWFGLLNVDGVFFFK